MRSVLHWVCCVFLCGIAAASPAQTDAGRSYSSRASRIVVPFSPGGSNDVVARIVGAKLAEVFGQPVVVENRPGAQGLIAVELVAKAAPDGHSILMGPLGPMAISPAIDAKLPYSPLRDFAPVTIIGSVPLILVVGPSLPVRSVSELVRYAKSRSNQVNYGSTSATFQLTSELFNLRTGTAFRHIPYKGSGDFVNAVMSGEVTIAFSDPAPATGPIKGGRMRGLAVTSATRHPAWPDLPTMAEAGVPDMEVSVWMGLFLPAATPPGIVQHLRDAVAKLLTLADVRERMAALSVDPVGNQPEEFRKFIAADIARWTAVARGANIKP